MDKIENDTFKNLLFDKPGLKEIDLSKRNKGEHPDLKEHTQYLVKIEETWYAGTFSKLWYGWNFNNYGWSSYQLWYGKEGADDWEKIYEIIE